MLTIAHRRMLTIGLTGGIGMGKSNVAKIFAAQGIPSFNADAAVHALQAPNGKAIPAIAAAFPGTVQAGVLDRAALRNIVLADPAALNRLEQIMHPLVRGAEQKFAAAARRAQRRAILLDIPLLFESQAETRMDVTLTVSCPRDVQIYRVRSRGTLRLEQIETLIAKQMPDAEKRRRADFTIQTGLSRCHTDRLVRRLIKTLLPNDV
jgi:dephospho-CoA kinase